MSQNSSQVTALRWRPPAATAAPFKFFSGEDTGTPVSEDYQVPCNFIGERVKGTINIREEEPTEENLKQYRKGLLKSALN